MRRLLLPLLFAASALAVEPYFGLSVTQPWSEDIRSVYHVLPGVQAGLRIPRSERLAFNAGLDGSLMPGTGAFGDFLLYSVLLRLGAEMNFRPAVDGWLTFGVIVGHGAERQPWVDREHNITTRWFRGTGLGAYLSGGMNVLRTPGWRLNLEAGIDLLTLPTDRELSDPGYYYAPEYWDMGLSGLRVGIIALRSGGGS